MRTKHMLSQTSLNTKVQQVRKQPKICNMTYSKLGTVLLDGQHAVVLQRISECLSQAAAHVLDSASRC